MLKKLFEAREVKKMPNERKRVEVTFVTYESVAPSQGLKVFFAACPELGMSAEGKTEEEANANLKKTIVKNVAMAKEEGTFEAIMYDIGWEEKNGRWVVSPELPVLEKVEIKKETVDL